MLVRRGGREDRQRRIAIGLRHVPQNLVVGAVFLDDQEDMLDERWLADMLWYRHRLGVLVNELRCHFDIGCQVPMIVGNHLLGVTSQLIRIEQRDQVDHAGILMGVEA